MIKLKRGTSEQWTNHSDTILEEGQPVVEMHLDTYNHGGNDAGSGVGTRSLNPNQYKQSEVQLKIGDGISTYEELPYVGDGRFVKLSGEDSGQTISGPVTMTTSLDCSTIYILLIYMDLKLLTCKY